MKLSTFVAGLLCVVAVTVGAQNAPTLCQQSPHKFNFGVRWRTWTDTARLAYVDGLRDGTSGTYLVVTNDLSATRREAVRTQVFTFFPERELVDVMTDLYSDPANVFIRSGEMVLIARDKLSGRDVEPRLRQARQTECAFTQASKQ